MLAAASCAQGNPTTEAGDVVPVGATKAEYQAAFADVERIVLNAQTIAAPEDPASTTLTDYFKSVTEWSGGKITFDVAYSQSVAPIDQVDDALASGKLDIAQFVPGTSPEEYPTYQVLANISFLGSQSPVAGFLASQAWLTEIIFASDSYQKEFKRAGMHVLIPVLQNGSVSAACTHPRTSLSDFNGAQISVSALSERQHAEALGGVPTSILWTEVYESLERGVIDCAISTITAPLVGGYMQVAPHITWDQDASMGTGWSTVAVSSSVWQDLPLIAQQLLHDRMGVFFKSNTKATWNYFAEGAKAATAAGGGIYGFKPKAQKKIHNLHRKMLKDSRTTNSIDTPKTLVKTPQNLASEWSNRVAELGYNDSVPYGDFRAWYRANANDTDLVKYLNAVQKHIISKNRPETP